VVPTDAPGFPQEEYDFAQAVEQALEMRPDYQQALLNLKILRLNLELSRDRVQPQVDLSGSWGFLGNSQLTTVLDPDGDPQQVAQGGVFSSHLEDLLSFDNFTWSIGVNVRQALGNRAALGQYRSDKLAIERALLQLRNLELSIVSEVRSLLRAIETNKKRVAATRISTELAKRRLEAEQKKFEVGTATSFNVSQFQERYVAAETAQTQAIIDLNRSVLSLQQALGMTLEANSIRIENGQPVLGPAAEPRPRPNP
jgi:outer membrane protein TolC